MDANPYVDTSLLVKLYVREPESPQAIALVLSFNTPLPLTHLQQLELRNALRLKRARDELTSQDARSAEKDFESDIGLGRFEPIAFEGETFFQRAEALSREYTASTMCRTLDILHVASALTIGCREFASFDQRQRTLATEVGLAVLPAA